MKKFILAAMAAIVMAGNVSAAESAMLTNADNGIESLQTKENAIDKFIQLIDGFTLAIEKSKTEDELKQVVISSAFAISAFEKENEKEIAALETTLTEEQQKKYEEKLMKAMMKFEAAAKKKAEQFGLEM